MKSMLFDLYCDNITPTEQINPKSKNYKKAKQNYYRCYEEFSKTLEKLDPPLDKKLEELIDSHVETLSYNLSATFIYGFKLGARIMTEVFSEDD